MLACEAERSFVFPLGSQAIQVQHSSQKNPSTVHAAAWNIACQQLTLSVCSIKDTKIS